MFHLSVFNFQSNTKQSITLLAGDKRDFECFYDNRDLVLSSVVKLDSY